MSSARHADEFVVREHFAEDRLRVVLVVDRRPEMSLYPAGLPWLHKPAAVRIAARMIVESAVAGQGFPGYLDFATGDAPRWVPPNRQENAIPIRDRELPRSVYAAPPNNLALALRHLEWSRADVPPGSFVFVLSDFLESPPAPVWEMTLSLGWDVVPVIVQDPCWEQSFPPVSGFVLPLAVPAGDGHPVRISRREAAERRRANEDRLERLLETFTALEFDPVLLSTDDPVEVLGAFMRWHERRRERLMLR